MWSRSGQYTGRTDLPLTEAGGSAAKALTPVLARRDLTAAFSSPLSRAMHTAELAGLVDVEPDPELLEWDYGGYEGLTEQQIRNIMPNWDLWRDGVIPGDANHPGETLQQVAHRTDRALERVRPLLLRGDVALIAHGHLQRVLTARWLGLAPSAGRLFGHPRPGTLSVLGTEHDQAVVCSWNVL